MKVAVLYAMKRSEYHKLPYCDVWDIDRDARRWPGGVSAIAHPPCAQWGALRKRAKVDAELKALGLLAIKQVRTWGGVLEHPAGSDLWRVGELPMPGEIDANGGWTLPILQFWFGHLAEKKTWLYIVGCSPDDLPPIPLVLGEASHVVDTSRRDQARRPYLPKSKREWTPLPLAEYLVKVAQRCKVYR